MKHTIPELIFMALFAVGVFLATWRAAYGLAANLGWVISASRGKQPRNDLMALRNLVRTGARCQPDGYFTPRQMRAIRIVAIGMGVLASAAVILLFASVT
jgi:hypothetical protein